ncbi:MAG: error-prone DNA polymerase, partial [Acidimicrobiales bacterium]
SGAEQARRFARYPGAVGRAAELGRACAFDLKLVAPQLPPFPVPPGHTEMTWLRRLAEEGAARRYGPRSAPSHPRAYAQIDYELDMIDQLGFAGYFLIVWDIVRFCNESGIYCQGRGSAANSAVCYVLGITKADAVRLGLLFERFLSPERDGPPDIDVDIESERREEAIQYVYRRYGRARAAQVANVITYRPRSAVRDMGKALGASQGQVDAWAKHIDAWGPLPDPAGPAGPAGGGIPRAVLDLARQTLDFPRHLGIHSGGMVICDRPVSEVCPVEWARMAERSVLQWDKEDCARAGLVKFDMLGLGMLSALHATVDHIRAFYGTELDLAVLPQEPEVYEMLSRADSVGVFQVESRAQMATLPRLRPRTFYDLVIEVALIRPGPIQGRSVHPYLRRRNNMEPVTYLHPALERSLGKTLGVPLFQEQLMQMAIDIAGFSGAEADQLRQAMGAKRSARRMEALRARFYAGMAERGATGAVADRIWGQMAAFANFGFPESHSVSFAYLVYASAWLKLHYPAAFLAGLLDSQPMGFWSPQSLVLDARRHGVDVRRPDVNASGAASVLEHGGESGDETGGGEGGAAGRGGGGAAVRLGISYVRNIGDELSKRIAAGQPYGGMEDVVRRCGLSVAQAEALATAGAFGCFEMSRREALWAAGAIAQASPQAQGPRRARAVPAGGG